jgi:BirA family transcriptional regulator, biotin operon repressor / biotin---[acetyl-CoA-carboxylase] ligase
MLIDAMPPDLDRVLRETFVVRAEFHSTIGSTNDYAARCVAQGDGPLPLLVVAGQQTAGRGRGTNRWWTGSGALALSVLVDAATVGAQQGQSPLVAVAVAVAVVEAVTPRVVGQVANLSHPVGIHWPNDIMIEGRKLAGILVEVLSDRRHIIGIGINSNNTLADAPVELRDTAATLRDLTGQPHDPTALLVDLMVQLDRHFMRLRDAPATIAARANELCSQRGQVLNLQWGDRTITGRCHGIAADGAILLETAVGLEMFYSGILMKS